MPNKQQGRAVACPKMPEYTHYKVLKILEQNPQVSQRELANELGVSLGKANYCLKALIEKGLVKANNFKNSSNKLAYFYVLTPSGIEAKAKISIQFLQRKMEEYEALGAEIEQLKREQGEHESKPARTD
jgi:EPS-associated MarR family transcriptional regulator